MPADSSPSQPSSDNPVLFRVAVFAHVTDPDVLPEMLVEVLHLHHLDAVIVARHTPAVLPLSLTETQASQLIAQLEQSGYAAKVVAEDALPDLSHATVLHHARPLETGLEILDLHGNPCEFRPWSELGVIAVGSVPAETTSRFVEQGRPSVVSAAPIPEISHVEVPERNSLELWCVTRDGR